ncbi:hypothetical protein, partial [uncultured Campylobacter sp.]|uniref:hypothetical protein n=1 Tax=uncultured Campylobacter sp. TaxID=218934 RepID=UPI00262C97B5
GERLRHSSPHPLYNKVKKTTSNGCFFTQGNQTRNAKFNQTKFSALKVLVSVHKFQILVKFGLKFE